MSVNEWQCDINKLILFCSVQFLLVLFVKAVGTLLGNMCLRYYIQLPLFICANSLAFFAS
jgi:hypothetical protein